MPFTLLKPVNSCEDFTVLVSGGAYFASMLYPYYPTDKTSISAVGCAVADVREKGDITVGYFVRGRWR